MGPVKPLTHVVPHGAKANAVLHAGFVVTGIVTTLLGPVLPALIARWSLSDERAGLFFTAQFGGSLCGVACSSVLIPRGYGRTLIMGFVSIMLGLAALTLGSEWVGLSATVVFGYGLGLVLPGTNLWVAEVAAPRRAAALSLLNLAWGVGAVACPALVLLAQEHHKLAVFLFGIAALAGLIALLLAVIPIDLGPQKPGPGMAGPRLTLWNKTAFALGALFCLYVGLESSLAGWAAAYAGRMERRSTSLVTLVPMFFWAALLSGRALTPVILRRMSEGTLLVAGLALAATGNGVLLGATTLRSSVAGLVTAGIGLASVFPLLVACLAKWYGEGARRMGGFMFALASLGGATIPWLVGLISTQAGDLRFGLLVPLAGSLAMLSLSAQLRQPSLT